MRGYRKKRYWFYCLLLVFAGSVPAFATQTVANVYSGIDVLRQNHFRQLSGRNVGLITNQTGIDRTGTSTRELLQAAAGVNLRVLFSPEHGIAGSLDTATITNATDHTTGLKVFSLYGKTRVPTSTMLTGLDTLVFDIQDIGTRFYTYISTMGGAMKVAAKEHIRFVVLDRPNPINGLNIAGPVLDQGRESFTGFHDLPIRHGMTIGELAKMFKAELHLDLDLQIIPLKGWRRNMYFDATGLPWVNPSPNMRNLNEAILYPGIGLLETTNLSVGRGTATPFEVLGAPWIESKTLLQALRELELPGIHFKAYDFVPVSSKFSGQLCHGLQLRITDRTRFDPVRTGLEIARLLNKLFPGKWDAGNFDRLLVNRAIYKAFIHGATYPELEAIYSDDLRTFEHRRQPFLMYEK